MTRSGTRSAQRWSCSGRTAPTARTKQDAPLEEFATFCAIAEQHGGDWRDWPEALHDPAGPAVTDLRVDLADRIAFHSWLQELCREQLDGARAAARDDIMGIRIVADLPVGVSAGGPDTWSQRECSRRWSGSDCPADAFNELGQGRGLPPFKPAELAAVGYAPFRDVVRSVLRHADGIRIDHIAGLWRLWWIPPGEPAHRGTYVHYDADAMLAVLGLEAHRAGAIIVGEDLGTVEEVVTATMHERGMLSSAVLWFERDWDAPGEPFILRPMGARDDGQCHDARSADRDGVVRRRARTAARVPRPARRSGRRCPTRPLPRIVRP